MLSEPPPLPDCTVTVVLCVAGVVPLAPLQVKVNVVVALSGPVLALPLVGSLPDHPPEAVQPLALLDDQLSVEDSPFLTLPGFALIETVGAEDSVGGTSCPVDVGAWDESAPPQPVSAAHNAKQHTRGGIPAARRSEIGVIAIELRHAFSRSLGGANLRRLRQKKAVG